MAEHKDRYLTATKEVGTADPISGLTSLVAALGDLNHMWEEAAKVAPEEIQTDVEAVRDAWASQRETAEKMAENPLKGLASGLMTGLMTAGSTQRVDTYTAENCPDVGAMFFASGGTGSAAGDATTASTPTSSSAAPETTDDGSGSSPSAEGPLQLGAGWSSFGPFLSSSGHTSSYLAKISGPVSLFVPEVGEVEVSASSLFGGSDVFDEQYLYFDDGDEPRLAGLITTRQPSSGLEPEGYVTSVISVNLSSGTARLAERLDGDKTPEQLDISLAGTAGESTVVVETRTDEDTKLVAYDLGTKTVAWQKTGVNATRHGAVGFGWLTDPSRSDGSCADNRYGDGGDSEPVSYHWTDLATGAPAFSMPLMVDGEDGTVCRNIGYPVSSRFSTVERYNTYEYRTEGFYVLDRETQETPQVPGPLDRADPVGTAGLILHGTERVPDTEAADLLVVDLSTGKEVFRIPQGRAEALNLQAEALFAGVLYLTTTDEQVAVDVESGKELGAWTVYPVSQAGSYTHLSDGTVHEDWTFDGT